VATIYTTADQAAANPAPNPVEGLDFTTVPDATSTYNIYDGQYVLTYYDEQADEYIFGFTAKNPTSELNVAVTRTMDIRVNDANIDGTARVDTIVERTTNNGVTMEGVNVKDGALTGVTTINGVTADVVQTITLTDNTTARTNIPGTTTQGCYQIFVRSVGTAGARAIFLCTASAGRAGVVNRLVSTMGTNGADVDIEWPAGGVPRLRHQAFSGGSGAAISYVVRVLAV
jgi:hypothetical protein